MHIARTDKEDILRRIYICRSLRIALHKVPLAVPFFALNLAPAVAEDASSTSPRVASSSLNGMIPLRLELCLLRASRVVPSSPPHFLELVRVNETE